MQTLTEKRVFGTKFGTTEVFVASETGLIGVTVSADQIGEFGLAHRGPVHAVAVEDRGVLLGTDEDVLHSERDQESDDTATAQSRTFSSVTAEPFGQCVAVGWGPTGPVAADDDGRVAGVDREHDTDPDWTTLGETEGVRAVDGELIAAADGVYRLSDAEIHHVGLDNVRDVAGHGTPLAATADGLFGLGNGWLPLQDGAFDCVGSDGHGHAHAVGPAGLVRRAGGADSVVDGSWESDELPVGSPVVDVDYGSGIVAAITADGTLCVEAGDGWRHQLLGVQKVSEVAVGPGQPDE